MIGSISGGYESGNVVVYTVDKETGVKTKMGTIQSISTTPINIEVRTPKPKLDPKLAIPASVTIKK